LTIASCGDAVMSILVSAVAFNFHGVTLQFTWALLFQSSTNLFEDQFHDIAIEEDEETRRGKGNP